MSSLQRQSATAHIHPSVPQCRLRSVSLRNLCSLSWYDSGRMWLRRTYIFCSPGSPTYVSLTCTRLAVRHARHGSVWPRGSRSFGWMLYLFWLLSVCSHCSCHFEARASAGLHRRGWDVKIKVFREFRRLFTGWWWWRLCRWSVRRLARSFWLTISQSRQPGFEILHLILFRSLGIFVLARRTTPKATHLCKWVSGYRRRWKYEWIVFVRNCCVARMLPRDAALVSEWKGVRSFQRSGYCAI